MKKVIIIGASSGIGRKLAIVFASKAIERFSKKRKEPISPNDGR